MKASLSRPLRSNLWSGRLPSLASILTSAFVFVSVFGATACGARTEGLDRTKLPETVRADYDLFARKCSKCHSLARPLSANITDDEQWVRYVNRMRRQPGSGISPADQEGILRFLRFYAAELRREQADKRGQNVPVLPAAESAPSNAAPTSTAPSPTLPGTPDAGGSP